MDLHSRLTTFLRRWRCAIVAALSLAVLAGCREHDEIQHYRMTLPEPARAKEDDAGPAKERILGGILQDGGQSWFFKMMGPAEIVARQAESFDRFLQSVRLNKEGERPLTWTLPEGWREGKEVPGRYATIVVSTDGDKPLELSVSRAGGSLYDNVKRWSGQVRPKPIKSNQLASITREVKAENVTIVRVDVAGPGGSGAMPPFARGR